MIYLSSPTRRAILLYLVYLQQPFDAAYLSQETTAVNQF